MNLLPLRQKKRIKLLILYQNIIFSGLILIILIVVLIIFLGGALIFLNFKYQEIERKVIAEQSRIIYTETVEGMERKVAEVNRELVSLKKFQDRQSRFNQIIENIYNDLLSDVQVHSFNMDDKTKRVIITGYSATREDLLEIKNTLESSLSYENVDFPLSNLVNSKNINFRFSFTYYED